MRTRLAFALIALCLLAPTANAGILTLSGVPSSYTPGGTFSFDVLLEDYDGVNFYDLELTMSASGSSMPGVEFLFESAMAGDLLGAPIDFDFASGFDVVGVTHVATLSGFRYDLTELSSIGLGPSVLASVTVKTSMDVGVLSISIDPPDDFLFTGIFDSFGDPIVGLDVNSAPFSVSSVGGSGAVPEPASTMVWLGMVLSAVFGCRKKIRNSRGVALEPGS